MAAIFIIPLGHYFDDDNLPYYWLVDRVYGPFENKKDLDKALACLANPKTGEILVDKVLVVEGNLFSLKSLQKQVAR